MHRIPHGRGQPRDGDEHAKALPIDETHRAVDAQLRDGEQAAATNGNQLRDGEQSGAHSANVPLSANVPHSANNPSWKTAISASQRHSMAITSHLEGSQQAAWQPARPN